MIQWIEVVNSFGKSKQQLLELQVDKGEASAIALALETIDSVLILDDNKAQKAALQLNLKFTGTIGIIIKAKLTGIIPSIKPILSKMKETNFRLSADIELQALNEANE